MASCKAGLALIRGREPGSSPTSERRIKVTGKITRAGLVALVLAGILVGAALADGTVEITAGTLTVADADVDFGAYAFSFTDRNTPDIPTTWNASDFAGAGLGWNVSMLASDFSDGSDSIPITVANQRLRATLPGAQVVCVLGDCNSTAVQSELPAYGYADPAIPLKVISCDPARDATYGCEPGSWDFNPSWRLTVPGGTSPSVYTSTWTVTIASGP